MLLTAALLVALGGAAAYDAGAAAPAMQRDTDTTFAVPASGRLMVDMMSGSVRVTTWERSEMRVRARHSRRNELEIRRRGNMVTVETDGHGELVDFEITVPRAYGVMIDGINVRTSIDGVQGNVGIDNVEGASIVSNVSGAVSVESVTGDVTITGVRGNVSVSTTNRAIRLEDIHGNVEAETVNGSIVLRRIDGAHVEASTVQGIVEFQGAIREGGRYYLGTHNGRITLTVPEQTSARISVNTRNGKVESTFPVKISSMGGGEYALTLGGGSARVELETYNGSVYLVRPGSR